MALHEVERNSANLNKKPKKKPKRRFIWFKAFMTFVLFTGVLVLLALSPVFNITTLKVEGSQHYKQEDIIASSNLLTGENGFRVLSRNIGSIGNIKRFLLLRCALAEDNIIANRAYIKAVKVKYALPGTFDIEVTERQPIGVIPYMGTNLVVDDEAYVLDTSAKATGEALPVIKGINFAGYETGHALKLDAPLEFEAVNKMLNILKASEESGNIKFSSPVNYIDVSDLSKVCVLVDSRITVNFGDVYNLTYEELLYRISFFKQIFAKNLKKQDKGLVDFTMGENPKFIPQ